MKTPKKLTFGKAPVATSRRLRYRRSLLSKAYRRSMERTMGWGASASYYASAQLEAIFGTQPGGLVGLPAVFQPGGPAHVKHQGGEYQVPPWLGVFREVERAEFAGQQMRNFFLQQAHYRTLPSLRDGSHGIVAREIDIVNQILFEQELATKVREHQA